MAIAGWRKKLKRLVNSDLNSVDEKKSNVEVIFAANIYVNAIEIAAVCLFEQRKLLQRF